MNKTPERAVALAEIEADHGWEERFAKSENKLAELARQARAQHAKGETTDLSQDQLTDFGRILTGQAQ